jgi:hypothetical protein
LQSARALRGADEKRADRALNWLEAIKRTLLRDHAEEAAGLPAAIESPSKVRWRSRPYQD